MSSSLLLLISLSVASAFSFKGIFGEGCCGDSRPVDNDPEGNLFNSYPDLCILCLPSIYADSIQFHGFSGSDSSLLLFNISAKDVSRYGSQLSATASNNDKNVIMRLNDRYISSCVERINPKSISVNIHCMLASFHRWRFPIDEPFKLWINVGEVKSPEFHIHCIDTVVGHIIEITMQDPIRVYQITRPGTEKKRIEDQNSHLPNEFHFYY